jgi:Helix-turn-helix domain
MPTENFKSQSVSKSTEKILPAKLLLGISFNPFHCSAEWHYLELTSRMAGALHSWGRRLSTNSEAFYPSVESISKYFGRHRTTVFKAIQELEGYGLAEVIRREPGKPVVYRFIDHDEWKGGRL